MERRLRRDLRIHVDHLLAPFLLETEQATEAIIMQTMHDRLAACVADGHMIDTSLNYYGNRIPEVVTTLRRWTSCGILSVDSALLFRVTCASALQIIQSSYE